MLYVATNVYGTDIFFSRFLFFFFKTIFFVVIASHVERCFGLLVLFRFFKKGKAPSQFLLYLFGICITRAGNAAPL